MPASAALPCQHQRRFHARKGSSAMPGPWRQNSGRTAAPPCQQRQRLSAHSSSASMRTAAAPPSSMPAAAEPQCLQRQCLRARKRGRLSEGRRGQGRAGPSPPPPAGQVPRDSCSLLQSGAAAADVRAGWPCPATQRQRLGGGRRDRVRRAAPRPPPGGEPCEIAAIHGAAVMASVRAGGPGPVVSDRDLAMAVEAEVERHHAPAGEGRAR